MRRVTRNVAVLGAALLLALPALARAAPNAYVSNFADDDVSQFNLLASGGLVPNSPATVGAGNGPQGIAVSPDGNSLYVANAGAPPKISQYDIAANGKLSPKSPATVDAVAFTTGIALSPDGDSAYATNAGSAPPNISQYDIAADGTLSPKSPATASAGSFPGGIVVSPDGESVYVTNEGGANLSQFDVDPGDGTLSAKSPATVATGSTPRGIAMRPNGDSVYIANADGTVSQFFPDPSNDDTLLPYSPATVTAGTNTSGIAVSPDGESAYATNSGSGLSDGDVSQYDIPGGAGDGRLSGLTPATVGAGLSPRGIAVSPNGKVVYVANNGDDDVTLYDVAANGTLTARSSIVPVGAAPFAVAVREDKIGPTTTINSGPSGTVADHDPSFGFSSNEPGSTFKCKLDAGTFGACSSPKSYTGLADGGHSFSVRATDFTGNTGPAATRTWRIEPSNEFTLGKAKRNKKKGTAKLKVNVPGPGAVEIARTKKVKGASASAAAAGEVTLPVKPKGKARKKLKKKGKAKVALDVTFTPAGGEPNTQSESLKLVKKR